MVAGDAAEQVWALVRAEAVRAGDGPRLVGLLRRLCRAASGALPAAGVGVSVMSAQGAQVMVAASDETFERVEELQFTMGEGPCLEAHSSGGPVLIPDLVLATRSRWPGYSAAAQDLGVRGVFALPLRVGAARLGALDVYRDRPGPLSAAALTQSLLFAEVAMYTLLDAQSETSETISAADEALSGRLEVYQAQGMVMIQLGISLEEAMTRLRAHSFAHNRRISDVSADVVARRLVLDRDAG